jgi:hypothetical protein
MAWMGWTLWFTAMLGYAAAKKAFTVPRIGFVRFQPHRTRVVVAALVGLGLLSAVLGMIAFIQTEGGGTPLWLVFALENYMLVIGAAGAALFCVAGYTFRLRRMYGYAALALSIFVVGHVLSYPLHYYVILLGALTLLFGLVMLFRFLRMYPLPVTGSVGDNRNEGQ